MGLIAARCCAIYSGRLDTILREALRLIMINAGGYKPLNCYFRLTRPVAAQ